VRKLKGYVAGLLDMGRGKRHIFIGIGIVAVLGVVCFLTPYERKHYTCLRCRLDRTVETYWRIPRVIDQPNECSRWYTSEYPDHKHDWKKSSCTYTRTALTKTYACRIFDVHRIWDVPPGVQKMYLATCTKDQMEEWFALLESEDEENHKKAIDLAERVLR